MQVNPSQLMPGCVLISDVIGKTNRPIIPKNTVLTVYHITVLEKFLVESVDVAAKLQDGELFTPKQIQKEKGEQAIPEVEKTNKVPERFTAHYLAVVEQYKKLFTSWQNHVPIDMPSVRKLLIPLFERTVEIGPEVLTLNRFVPKHDYFYHHGVAVGMLAAYLAKKMGYPEGKWLQVGLAGFLCDCGMAKIDPKIVGKESILTESEQAEIKKHPIYSYRMIEHIPFIKQEVKLAVLQHHERFDGSGYPLGLSKQKIHIYARIIAICDTYHAITCERSYRKKQSPFRAIEELRHERFSQLDHHVVQTFIRCLTNYSPGTRVRLSNQQTGEIVFMEDNYPTRPIVRMDETGNVISLKDDTALFIDEILP